MNTPEKYTTLVKPPLDYTAPYIFDIFIIHLCDKAKVMVEIIIRRKIVTEKIATKLKNIASCAPEGSCIPVALPNGDFTFDVTEDIKAYWDSLHGSQQLSIIRIYVEGNLGLEDVIKYEMNKSY